MAHYSFDNYLCVADTGAKNAANINKTMKLPVIRGVSHEEGVALGAFVTSAGRCAAVPDRNLGIHGALLHDGMHLVFKTMF